MISDVGDVFSVRRDTKPNAPNQKSKILRARFLKTSIGSHGYLAVSLCGSKYMIHRLVASNFIGDIPKGMVVNHRDGDKYNCVVDNLEITTYHGNNNHAFDNGLIGTNIFCRYDGNIYRSKTKMRDNLCMSEYHQNRLIRLGKIEVSSHPF